MGREFYPCRGTSSTSPASKLRILGVQHEGKAPVCRRHPYLRRWLSLTRIGYEYADSSLTYPHVNNRLFVLERGVSVDPTVGVSAG